MIKSEIRDFTKGNITKQLLVFTGPLFLSNLLQIVYNMVDMIVVGRTLGKVGISAVSVGGDISNLLTFMSMGFGSAGQVIIAKYIGAGRKEKLSRFIGTMFSFLMVCSVILSVVGICFQDIFLRLMNTPAESFAGAKEYSVICMAGMVFIYGYNIVSAILRGMGDSKHPFMFIAVAAVINLILDILFVMVFDIGPAGAALATVISQGVSFISSAIFIIKHKERFELNVELKDFIKWDFKMLEDLIKLGVPMAIKTASIQVSKLFVNSWINSYGIAVSAFSGIANKISATSNLISSALNVAGSTMVGQNIAAKEYKRVVAIMKNIACISLSIAFMMSVSVWIWPDMIFGIFTDDLTVLEIGYRYIPIAVLLFFGGAARSIMNALINGSGNYVINFATAILDGIVLRIGLSLLFGLALGMNHYGFWLGDALAGFTPFWIGLVFYISGDWKKQKTE